jgi:hypothetical protein
MGLETDHQEFDVTESAEIMEFSDSEDLIQGGTPDPVILKFGGVAPLTACLRCTHANWFSTKHSLKSYCQKMMLITYHSDMPMSEIILECAGSRDQPEAQE